jgi:hypothetical protein
MANEPPFISRGDQFVVYADHRPTERVYGEVTRVAKDRAWADIRCCTWAVMWTKRMPLHDGEMPIGTTWQTWDQLDLDAQERDWQAKRDGR